MLDLTSLDDTTPPDADAALLMRVHARAARRRRRARVAAIAAVAVPLLVAASIVAVVASRHVSTTTVNVAPPGPARGLRHVSTPSRHGSAVFGVLEIHGRTFRPGATVPVTLFVDNGTGRAITWKYAGCGPQTQPWRVLLSQGGEVFEPGEAIPGCTGPAKVASLGLGVHRFASSVSLQYFACSDLGAADLTSPPCKPDGTYPPLAAGTYQIVFGAFGTPLAKMHMAPVTVQVRGNPVTAR